MPHHQNEKKILDKTSNSKFIVLGEDDIDDEELLKELFSSVDDSFSLTFMNNGKQIIDYLTGLQNHLPCLIILDYNMPQLNGADILKELQGHPRYAGIPKIIWSTSQTDTYREKCLELGADDYIIKPSKVNEMVRVIQHMISFC